MQDKEVPPQRADGTQEGTDAGLRQKTARYRIYLWGLVLHSRSKTKGGLGMMTQIGRWLAGMSWPWQFVFLVVFLAVVWVVTLPFKRIHPYRGQLMVLAGVFWVGILFFLISFSFTRPIFPMGTYADTIPRIWFYALVPVVVITFITIATRKVDEDPKWGNVRLLGLIIGGLVASIALFGWVGYYVSSAAFIVYSMYLLGTRSKVELICVPAGWILFSWGIFAQLLNVRLPVGRIFAALTGGYY